MTNHGDDCYFFYYSNCTKGDTCPFRHCEAAMGSEIVCNLWQEGRCFRTVCKFRHMEITKNRKEICCYWENQPAGCQKPHCAFFHERPRCIDGTFVPPDKSLNKTEEQPHEEPAPPAAASLSTATNPQLRGVKTETQEPVPSPTHPPVVINPADDDEDEDDQFSEEGEDGKVGLSPRKPPKSDDSLSFGVSTLEEIRLRKALKASMKRAGYPMQSPDTQANGEKENIQSLFGPTLYQAGDAPFDFEETGRPRGSLAERLGRKMPNTDVKFGGVVPLKRGLSGRLGRIMDEPLQAPQKALKPIKDRLGLAVSVAPTSPQPADTDREPKKAPKQIRIKTLEEIRQEKAARSPSQGLKGSPSAASPESNTSKTTTGVKRAITIRDDSINHTKTFLEGLCAKKKRQEGQDPKPKRSQAETNTPQDTNVGQLRVKTLEEIRREKAAKIQARQTLDCENKKSSDTEESPAKKPHLLHVKPNSPTGNATTEKSAEVTEKPRKAAAAPETSAAPSNNVKVKTFEEIMLEKRLRKQEMEDRARDCAEAEPAQKHGNEGTFRRKAPTKVRLMSPGSSSPSSTTVAPDVTVSTQKLPVGKPISLRLKAASSLSTTTRGDRGAAVNAAPSVPVKQPSPPPEAESDSQSPGRSREVPDKNTRSSTALSPPKQDGAAPRGPAAEGRTSDKTLNRNQKTSPEHTAEAKVRPKLNVKPSVVKPAVQMKPGQKRRGAERSAVAAVKPLSSTSTVQQEPACRGRREFPSAIAEAQLSAAVPRSPSTPMDSGSSCSPLTEDLQTVPVFKQSQRQDTKQSAIVAATEACTVPESPVTKTPTQAKSRRLSIAAPRTASTSAMDDFEELINQFTEDHLEGDVDPGIEEDDLLQELSEMIDS